MASLKRSNADTGFAHNANMPKVQHPVQYQTWMPGYRIQMKAKILQHLIESHPAPHNIIIAGSAQHKVMHQ